MHWCGSQNLNGWIQFPAGFIYPKCRILSKCWRDIWENVFDLTDIEVNLILFHFQIKSNFNKFIFNVVGTQVSDQTLMSVCGISTQPVRSGLYKSDSGVLEVHCCSTSGLAVDVVMTPNEHLQLFRCLLAKNSKSISHPSFSNLRTSCFCVLSVNFQKLWWKSDTNDQKSY